MKRLDYALRNWRYRMAAPYVPAGSRVLDIGGYDGSFFAHLPVPIVRGVCLDPLIEKRVEGTLEWINGRVDDRLPFEDGEFDVVVLLAVYEHLGHSREAVTREISRVLNKGGRAVLTVPGAMVDTVLHLLRNVRLIDGMSVEEHEEFDCSATVGIFARSGLSLVRWQKFQLGMNNLFVFEKKGS